MVAFHVSSQGRHRSACAAEPVVLVHSVCRLGQDQSATGKWIKIPAAGLTDQLRSVEDLVALWESEERGVGKSGIINGRLSA